MRRINSKEYWAYVDYKEYSDEQRGGIDFMIIGSDVNDIVSDRPDGFGLNWVMGKPYIRKQFMKFSTDVLFFAALNCACRGVDVGMFERNELEEFLLKTFASDIYNDMSLDDEERANDNPIEVKFNDNGTVSINNMPMKVYNVINRILACIEYGFERHPNEYVLRKFEPCGITLDEKDAMDKECWMI